MIGKKTLFSSVAGIVIVAAMSFGAAQAFATPGLANAFIKEYPLGRVGTSDLSGDLKVDKVGDRRRVDADLRSNGPMRTRYQVSSSSEKRWILASTPYCASCACSFSRSSSCFSCWSLNHFLANLRAVVSANITSMLILECSKALK